MYLECNPLFFSIFLECINIKLNVYKLKDSSLGLYHTGVEFGDLEYTYCHGIGIAYHKPKKCHFATLLGSKHLGSIEIDKETFGGIKYRERISGVGKNEIQA